MDARFSNDELFLIEMALDEAMWHLNPGSPFYERLRLLDQRVHAFRHHVDDIPEEC